jgi:hypothetical protein
MGMRLAAAILALLLAAACAGGGATPPRGEIRLALGNGKSLTFRNDDAGCDWGYAHCIRYTLQPSPPGCRCYAVWEAHYEGGFNYLIDAGTGRRTDLPFEPIFSADGRQILFLNTDATGDFPGDTIEIWRRQDDAAVREWAFTPREKDLGTADMVMMMSLLRWDRDEIRLHLATTDYMDGKRQLHPAAAWDGRLRRDAQGWHAELRKPGGG